MVPGALFLEFRKSSRPILTKHSFYHADIAEEAATAVAATAAEEAITAVGAVTIAEEVVATVEAVVVVTAVAAMGEVEGMEGRGRWFLFAH